MDLTCPGKKEEGRPGVPVAGERSTDLRAQKIARGEKMGESAGNGSRRNRKPGQGLLILCSRRSQGHVEVGIGDTWGLQAEYLLARSKYDLVVAKSWRFPSALQRERSQPCVSSPAIIPFVFPPPCQSVPQPIPISFCNQQITRFSHAPAACTASSLPLTPSS